MSNLAGAVLRPDYSLHSYQRQVFADIVAALSSSQRRAVAHLPTGAGKTRVATHVACHLLNLADSLGSLLIWLASTGELCEQACEQLSRGWVHLGLRDVHVHRHWGTGLLDLRSLQSGFLVTGLAKLRAAAANDPTLLAHVAGRVCGVIFDEAHQAVAPTYSYVTEQLCSRRTSAPWIDGNPWTHRGRCCSRSSACCHVQPHEGQHRPQGLRKSCYLPHR